jgi:hypothetical protein
MKLCRLMLLIVACLFLSATPLLRAAEAPKLETLLSEYKKARTDVLSKLNQSYAGQADDLANHYRSMPDLDAADRTRSFAKSLRGPQDSTDLRMLSTRNTSDDSLAILQTNYAQARRANLLNVYTFYTTAATNLRNELQRSKNQEGAAVVTTFLDTIKADAPKPEPQATPVKKKKAPVK